MRNIGSKLDLKKAIKIDKKLSFLAKNKAYHFFIKY